MPDVFWPVILVGAAMLAFAIIDLLQRRRRTRRVRRYDFPRAWLPYLEDNVPLYKKMPLDLREELQDLVLRFIEDKDFHAGGGLPGITNEIKITLAGNACVLLLNGPHNLFYEVRSVFVYPGTFIRAQPEDELAHLSEVWPESAMVLAWDSAERFAWDVKDGMDLAVRGFARQLGLDGSSTEGGPAEPFPFPFRYTGWAHVLGRGILAGSGIPGNPGNPGRAGKITLPAAYENGAKHPAAFFAGASEAFFGAPGHLRLHHPELYEHLRRFYKVDPARWH